MKFLSRIKNPGFFICFYQSFLLYLPSLMIYNMKTLMKNHKTAMYCLKYIPVLMFLSMWGYTVLAVIGVDLIITDIVVGCSILPSILIFALSDVFHFCWIHKCLTGYSLLVDILININKYIGLGALLLPLKTLFAIIGLGLFITLLFKNKLKKNGV